MDTSDLSYEQMMQMLMQDKGMTEPEAAMSMERSGPPIPVTPQGLGTQAPVTPGVKPRTFEMLLQDISEQGPVKGKGMGMSDSVDGVNTDDGSKVAVSAGEYVFPADVVSMLGDGDTDAGGRVLENLIKEIRTMKTGKGDQPSTLADLLGSKTKEKAKED